VLCHFFGRGWRKTASTPAHTTCLWSALLRTSHRPPLHRGSLSHISDRLQSSKMSIHRVPTLHYLPTDNKSDKPGRITRQTSYHDRMLRCPRHRLRHRGQVTLASVFGKYYNGTYLKCISSSEGSRERAILSSVKARSLGMISWQLQLQFTPGG
jgi:hypothetical protein